MSELLPGLVYYPQFLDRPAQEQLLEELRRIIRAAPLYTPRMPRFDKPLSVRMTNCGSLGWMSDKTGYRYQPLHPETNEPWPAIPHILLEAWKKITNYPLEPEACLINFSTTSAKMGLHQDKDEKDFNAPVLSLSLGDTGLFRIGGEARSDKTRSIKLESGDALVMGGASRLAFHGIDRIYPSTSTLLKDGGRINLTLRRVSIEGIN
jgi:DNA oxidative demethylase